MEELTEDIYQKEEDVSFKYKDPNSGDVIWKTILPGAKLFSGKTSPLVPLPELYLEGINVSSRIVETFLLKNIIHNGSVLKIGDKVTYYPAKKSERITHGVISFIEGDTVYFYTGSMPEEYHGTAQGKQPCYTPIEHEGKTYQWYISRQKIQNLKPYQEL